VSSFAQRFLSFSFFTKSGLGFFLSVGSGFKNVFLALTTDQAVALPAIRARPRRAGTC
jgi:hypothetical protein